jgi:hypothetical protein
LFKREKEVPMRKKVFRGMVLSLLILFLISPSPTIAKKRMELIGREAPNFTLPSTLDRVINYAEEYYGKHHLILTFFPAAYTPL